MSTSVHFFGLFSVLATIASVYLLAWGTHSISTLNYKLYWPNDSWPIDCLLLGWPIDGVSSKHFKFLTKRCKKSKREKVNKIVHFKNTVKEFNTYLSTCIKNGCPNLAKCSCYLGTSERATSHWYPFTNEVNHRTHWSNFCSPSPSFRSDPVSEKALV